LQQGLACFEKHLCAAAFGNGLHSHCHDGWLLLQLRELLRLAPKQRQTMLFSATFNDDVQQLVQLSLKQPVRLAADAVAMAPKSLSQEVS
jgi:hypothetical protein